MDVLNRFKYSSFVRNVLTVMTGTALAQALGLALSPVVSRLYTPENFGLLGNYIAVLGVISSFITLDYSQAQILPKKNDDALGLLSISIISTLAVTILTSIGCLAFPKVILGFMKATNSWMLLLLVIGILVSGLNLSFQGWCIRSKAFKRTATSQVVRSLTSNGTQVGMGYLRGGSFSLIFAVAAGDILATSTLASVPWKERKTVRKVLNWRRILHLAKEYHDFPLYSASTNLINALSLGLPIFLLTRYYGIAVAGAYAFGIRLIQAPMDLLLRALRQVLFQKAAQAHNEGHRLLPLYLKIIGTLFAVGVIPALVMYLWAPQIFARVFGEQWRTAGVFAHSLVIWLLFMFCNLPADLFSRIMRLQRKMFFFNLAILMTRALALTLGGTYLKAPQTVLLFSAVGAVMNIAFMVIIGFALTRIEAERGFPGFFSSLGKS